MSNVFCTFAHYFEYYGLICVSVDIREKNILYHLKNIDKTHIIFMERKKVTYRVFTIQNASLSHDASDLKDELLMKLTKSNIEQRLIPVHEDDDSVNDLLSSFASPTGTLAPEYFYGVMMRLKPAKEIKALPDDYIKLTELSETQLQEIQEVAGKTVCSGIFHFLIRGTFLITDLPQIQTITGFEKYINRFLGDAQYSFRPYLHHKDLRLNDISKVVFKETFAPTSQDEDNPVSIQQPVKKLFRYISPEVKGLNKILEANIVSANMVINFEKPRKMTQQDYNKQLGAILAPIQNLENVYFTLHSGMKILGSNLVYTRKEILEDEIITPLTYIKSMRTVLDSIQ